MNILIVGFSLNETDRAQIAKLATATRLDTHKLDVKDIKSSAIEFTDIDFLLIFGERAGRPLIPMAKEQGLPYLSLPTIRNLYPVGEGGIIEDRVRTFKELSTLVESMKSGQIQIVEDRRFFHALKPPAEIASLTIPAIQSLEKAILASGRTSWTCPTKDGKVVGITIDPTEVLPDVDFSITFAELLAMRAAIDILNVQEIRYVSTSKHPTTQNS